MLVSDCQFSNLSEVLTQVGISALILLWREFRSARSAQNTLYGPAGSGGGALLNGDAGVQ